jgi:hypothetical protein
MRSISSMGMPASFNRSSIVMFHAVRIGLLDVFRPPIDVQAA